MEGSLGQKLNRHKFSIVSASKLPFSKESGEAAARFVVESETVQLRFHYKAELSNVVVRVDLRSAQVQLNRFVSMKARMVERMRRCDIVNIPP